MKTVDLSAIKRLRGYHKKTQDDIANALSMSRQAYISREKHGNFTKEELEALATFLEVKVEELYVETPIPISDSIDYLVEANIRTEALLRAVVAGLAKLLAEQTGEKETTILADMTKVANQQSEREMAELKKRAGS